MLDGQFAPNDATPPGACARFTRRSLPLAATLAAVLVLGGCSSTSNQPAPIVSLDQSSSGGTAPGGTYVVKPGDSLYGIARRNNVDVASLERANGISNPNHLTVGQVLTLPGGGAAAPAGPMGAAPVAPAASSKPLEPVPLDQQPPAGGQPPGQPSQSPANNQAAVPAVPPASSSAPARASDANLIAWGWPAQGSVVQKFNPPKNRGIDISGNAGDPVYAAADGKVKYAGNGIPGLGNLVIIEHSNGFMTAYAHNQTLLVKCNQVGQDKGCPNVKRGAKIATLGETDAATPMLHFEIRKQGDPVDPLQYLPAR
ncbi:MAG TPA: peptidoglycan DD-metalloendopeptidase family protein [Bordetella sp.]|mgnify:CR=1 FL=1|uniref:peptidoglycan DD-metalloendopeptidase family protein n=1 Tax=Bordetella sp. TaxID=28081 RepID=UPI002ED3B0DE